MKPLKQQLRENIPILVAFIDKDVEKTILKTVKEWLERKRQEEIISPDETAKCHNRIGLLNELLEELKEGES